MKRRDVIKGLTLLPLTGGVMGSTLPLESGFSALTSPRAVKRPTGKSVYEPLGVRPLINGGGTVTVIGACRLLPEVQKAMDDAVREYVHLDELMDGAGRRLAELTGAESGCVTAGASAAITAATAACVTGGDPDKLWLIPDTAGMKDEVVITSYSRTAYDAAARAVGVRMVQVADLDELRRALGPRTAMVMVLGGLQSRNGPFSLKEISAIAKPLGIPILVDAAAEAPDVPNPHITDGADLVAYSGGKRLRGPQCSGLLIGRKDLILAARINTGPHHGFGRGFKVGREEIMGVMAAIEMWYKRDHLAEAKMAASLVENIAKRLRPIRGVTLTPGRSLRVEWDMDKIPLTGYDVEQLLWDGNPRVVVSLSGSYLPFPPNMAPNIRINTSQLESGEEKIIADRVFAILSTPPKMNKPNGPATSIVSGEWDLEMHFPASTVRQTLNFEQKGSSVSGTHHGLIGPRDLAGTVYGNNIIMCSSYTVNGARINYTFTGTINDDTMGGKVSLSEYGKAEWTAKRHLYNL